MIQPTSFDNWKSDLLLCERSDLQHIIKLCKHFLEGYEFPMSLLLQDELKSVILKAVNVEMSMFDEQSIILLIVACHNALDNYYS